MLLNLVSCLPLVYSTAGPFGVVAMPADAKADEDTPCENSNDALDIEDSMELQATDRATRQTQRHDVLDIFLHTLYCTRTCVTICFGL
jgi:hypothetical protein